VVPRPITTESRDTIELLAVLEGTAARFAAERGAAPSDLVALRATNETIKDLISVTDHDTFERYLHLDHAFHRRLLKAARSQILERAIEELVSLPHAGPDGSMIAEAGIPIPHEILIVTCWEHAGLVDAIKRREGSRAESLASQHARHTLGDLQVLGHAH
jgi:GntR family transcriptional regulator of vanillate catabolism